MNYELKNTSGASLLFVLAVTFLLIAISTSVLVAAGAGRGAMARQAEHNQMRLLDESIHDSIMHSLKDTDNPNSLGVQIITALYNLYYPNNGEQASSEIGEIVFNLDTFTLLDSEDDDIIDNNVWEANNWTIDITLTIPESETSDERVRISPARLALFSPELNEYGVRVGWHITDRVPKTAIVNFTLLVSVEITASDRRMVSEAEYIFTGDEQGFNDKDPNPAPNGHTCTTPAPPAAPGAEPGYPPCHPNSNPGCTGTFEIGPFTEGGEWTLERRGIMIHRED